MTIVLHILVHHPLTTSNKCRSQRAADAVVGRKVELVAVVLK